MLKLRQEFERCEPENEPFKFTLKMFAAVLGRNESWVQKTKKKLEAAENQHVLAVQQL